MILDYTNNTKKFQHKITETLASIDVTLDNAITRKLKTLKVFKNSTEEGYIFYLKYSYDLDLYSDIEGNLVSMRMNEEVKSIDISCSESVIQVCLILLDSSTLSDYATDLHFDKVNFVEMVVETTKLESIEDILVTCVFTEIILNHNILSLCTLSIFNLGEVDKPAFYMYLAVLCSRFLSTDTTSQIITDFDVDRVLLKNYLSTLMPSLPTDTELDAILNERGM